MTPYAARIRFAEVMALENAKGERAKAAKAFIKEAVEEIRAGRVEPGDLREITDTVLRALTLSWTYF